jgi:hypothetical protein
MKGAEMEERSPDPVQAPEAYQQLLLSLLGGDDPVEVQAATPASLRRLVDDAGDDLWIRPEPAEWSVLGGIAHVADAELVMASRYRFVLAHEEPPLIGYDQDLWVERLHGGNDDPEPILALFEALRSANLELWRRTPAEGRSRIGIHGERGPESYDLSFRMLAGHDRFHLAQAERALVQLRAGR